MPIFPLEELRAMSPQPRIHFIGIGGVHMSAMAELLSTRGFPVTGNDKNESDNVAHLRQVGVHVDIGHLPEYVRGADIVVRNAAIHDDSPDVMEARALGLPIYERPEVLGALMKDSRVRVCVSGTHGKTTTTAMCAGIAVEANTDPTIFCGGKLPEINSAFRFGGKDVFIAEACEYCDSFLSFYPTHGVILNVEEDHLDYFKDIHQIRDSFRRFADLVPVDGGVTAAFGDDESIREFLIGVEKKIVYFGFHAENDYIAANVTEKLGYYSFDVVHDREILCHINLAVPGKHAVIDALAAFTISVAYGVEPEVAARALEKFHGAKRRFEKVGTFKGIQVVDDFAHHPGELKTTLDAARRMGYDRVICLFQPHTYTRTEALYKDFAKELSAADVAILAPIYPAREENIHNISSALIGNEMESCLLPASMEEAEDWIRREAREGDLILTVGAGDIFKVAYSLIKN